MGTEVLNINGVMVPHNIIPIIGDGACLFRCISFHLHGNEIFGREVREQIVEHVIQHWDEYKVMTHDNDGNNYKSAEEYEREMSLQYTYGSLCELVAASKIYEYCFEIYRNGELYEKIGINENPVARIRFTNDLSNGHFDVYVANENGDRNEQVFVPQLSGATKRRTRLGNRIRQKQKKNARSSENNAKKEWKAKALSGMNYDPNVQYEEDKSIDIGAMVHGCSHCSALKWKDETTGMCCCGGKVQLSPHETLPEPLNSLIMDLHPDHSHFMDRIRKYNSCFQMTSFGATKVVEDGFMPTFKVQGQVYHLIGSLMPQSQNLPKFLQIYFVGEDEKEANLRCRNCPGVKESLVKQLQNMMHQHNIYVKEFKTTLENTTDSCENLNVVICADRTPVNAHRGRYNAPTTNEVAIVIVGQQYEHRDILIERRNNKLKRISEVHRSYDALQYPLLFCRGEDGYSIDIPLCDPITKQPQRKTVSALNFYSYQLMIKQGQVNHLHYFRSLFSQYIVDMYAKIETERLKFIKYNQSKLRTENYIHLKDAIGKGDTNLEEIGKMVVLPSSFTGSPRYMHERTQDAMTYVRHYGRPDLFVTFTCNPKWREIERELLSGQKPHDRHDIIARVFHLKIKKLMKLLIKTHLFGPVRCYMYSVEWQKRGLPHVHILLWLENRISPNMVDDVIRAEIPDQKTDPLLHDIVTTNMIHGPCGILNKNSPCMKDGRCGKRFPRNFLAHTQTGDDGYPLYRRRSPENGGYLITKNNKTIDNRWVVPYNPTLLRVFNAHINVEYCNSVKSIKYICKYVNKGSDQAALGLENNKDEVALYESGRYISSSEAVWRILAFSIHERFPTVMHLAVHLENGQRIYFNPNAPNTLPNIINSPKNTTLLSFFDLCKVDEFARTLLYVEVPSYYTWKNNVFVRRKRGDNVPGWAGVKKDSALGRIYTIHPSNVDCFHLRLLLSTVRGPVSFEHIRTVNGVVHTTYRSACLELGLLENDKHWDLTMEEAALSKTPHQLRDLFTTMIIFCHVSNAQVLWDKYKMSLSEDVIYQTERQLQASVAQIMDKIFNKCLIIIEDQILSLGGHCLHIYGLPQPNREQSLSVNRELLRETSYDVNTLAQEVSNFVPMLTDEQLYVHDQVMKSVNNNEGKMFFLDAPGGTGKTFLINLLLAQIRKEGYVAISAASSGIAATLLNGGKTAHSAFKLPLNLNQVETPLCNISKQSNLAQVLKECKLIVWDESTMAHKSGFEALNRTLKDIRENNCVMGGVTILLAGDFRQTLPVVPRGTRADEIQACIKSSNIWSHIQMLSLKKNMRVHLRGDPSAQEFANMLLKIGNGDFPSRNEEIIIPAGLGTVVNTLDELISNVYPEIALFRDKPIDWLCERAILTPKNEKAAEINEILLRSFEEVEKVYVSFDTVVNTDDVVHYPPELLNSLNPPGLPTHKLTLKIGAPVMLLRNLKPPKLCNGTRLQIKAMHRNVIEATVLTGCARGECVFIPRIPLIPANYPFEFKRLQFPLKVCFAITINKSQGQTLKVAGLDVRENCFSHGQFYVACSRVSSSQSLFLLAPGGTTRNVVYKEVLQKQQNSNPK